uniref:Uncharacterized protein n=1 Tax=Peronospora matthiolae TaxID=2874970 RepID=A0AAV1UH87_9STRA
MSTKGTLVVGDVLGAVAARITTLSGCDEAVHEKTS